MNSSPNQYSNPTPSPESQPAQPPELAQNPSLLPPTPPNPAVPSHDSPTLSVLPASVAANTEEKGKTEEEALVRGGTSEEELLVKPSANSSSGHNPDVHSAEAPSDSEVAGIERQEPIPPPSEQKQYRAVGLVQGRYTASEEQFTKGMLVTPDGTQIDAVLLGRVMSLVKNHLNLDEEHLWVVYPRTRQNDGNLHAQIMGVWEPEQLNKPKEPSSDDPSDIETDESQTDSQASTLDESPKIEDGYFSVRGEVVFQSQDQGYIVVKIKQAPRKQADKPKFFKLKLNGTLAGKAVGHFWDLHVQRQADALVIQEGNDMGFVISKRKPFKPRPGGRPGGGQKRFDSKRPQRPTGSKPTTQTSPVRRDPPPKPVIKRSQPKDE